MSLTNYYRKSHQDRINLRVTVLTCYKNVHEIRSNDSSIRLMDFERRRIEAMSIGGGDCDGSEEEEKEKEEEQFDGILAYEMITAFELWRVILEFV